jgi:hypothetical protein
MGTFSLDSATMVVDHPLPPVVHPDVAVLAGAAAGELRRLAGEGGTPSHAFFPDVITTASSASPT